MKKPLLSELTLREKVGQMLNAHQWDVNRVSRGEDWKTLRTVEEKKALLEYEKFGTINAMPGAANRGLNDRLGDNQFLNPNGRVRWGEGSREHGLELEEQAALYNKIPHLVTADAEREGAGTLYDDLTTTCCPLAIGATNDEDLAYELGAAIARELRCVGINWRWAPVVDIHSRFSASITRSYTPDDAEKMIRIANAHIKGVQSQGVAATAKHFPGNDGLEYRDGHFSPGNNESTLEEWWACQGKIFQAVIDAGVYAIMTTHSGFPAVDDEIINGNYIPVTLSKKVTTDLLKEKMGFKGVVITDSIEMNSLLSLLPYEELVVRMVNAGNDVILGPFLGTGDIIIKAVEEGKIKESRIDDACQRVLDMKEKLGMFEEGYRGMCYLSEDEAPKTRRVNEKIAEKAITLIRDRNNLMMQDMSNIKKVSVICSTHAEDFFDIDLVALKEEFEKRGIEVYMQRRLKGNEELERIAEDSDLIIYAAYVDQHCPYGNPSLFGEECKTYLYAFTSGKEKSIGISFGYPYIHYDIMENADCFINAYGKSPELMKATVRCILGEIPFKGESPVKLEPARRKW